jgi:CBS domain-containing protein
MVSDRDFRDLLGQWSDDEARARYAQQTVDAIAPATAVTLSSADDVTDAVDTMLDNRVGALPVVDDGQVLVGILSYVDVLRAISESIE